jgi:hypothetical protein
MFQGSPGASSSFALVNTARFLFQQAASMPMNADGVKAELP